MKKNKICLLILLVAMFFSLYVHSVAAAESSAATFDIVDYEYCDGSGNAVNELSPNATITAKATVKKNESGDAPVTLMFAAYKDGRMVALSKGVDTLTDEVDTKELKATITLPADVEGCTLRNFVIDDILNIDSLTSSATFNSDNADILSASIGGVEIPEFDDNNSATIELPANAVAEPLVKALCDDYTTEVAVDYTEDVITLTATSMNGTEKVYTVNYTRAEPQLEDVTFRQYRWLNTYEYANPPADSYTDYSGTDLKVAKVISLNLDDVEDKTQTLAAYLGITDASDMATKVTPQFSNDNLIPKWYYSDIDPIFDGLNVVLVPYLNGSTTQMDTVWGFHAAMTFTTPKSVRIYYVANDTGWRNAGESTLGTYLFKLNRVGTDYPGCANETIQEIVDNPQPESSFNNIICTQDIIVPEGGDPVTTTVMIRSGRTWDPPFFAYEFID